VGFGVFGGRSGTVGGVDSSVPWIGGRQVMQILVGPVPEQERVGGDGASGGEEAHFIEETCTQSLYPCSLMAVELLK
jgi:hypothetical protein